MLTEKQYKLLMFINKVTKETGCSPSFDEMRTAVGLKSKSGIHALIGALEEREFIKKLPHKARALEVIRMPKFKPRAIIEEEKTEPIFTPKEPKREAPFSSVYLEQEKTKLEEPKPKFELPKRANLEKKDIDTTIMNDQILSSLQNHKEE